MHFCVLVIGDDVDGQLAPFDETSPPTTRHGKACRLKAGGPKWDWYEMGGRWRGSLMLKPGKEGVISEKAEAPALELALRGKLEIETPEDENKRAIPHGVDQARKGDVNFEGMLDYHREAAAICWELSEREPDQGMRYFRYGRDPNETREMYIARCTSPLDVSVVVKNGQWHSIANKIAPTASDEKDWNRELRTLLADVDDSTLLTIVDCHV